MSKHWSERLADLSVDQLQDLITEIGPVAPLTRELNAKLLMRHISGLPREIALILIAAEDAWVAGSSDPHSELIAALFARSGCSEAKLMDLLQFCGDGGRKVFQRAVRRYLTGPSYMAQAINGHETLDYVMRQQIDADPDGVKAAADAEACTDEFADADRESARQWLRDACGINDPGDWAMMLDALQCIRREDPQAFNRPGLQARNAITKRALRLMERARAYGCTPSKLMEWKKLRTQIGTSACNPNSIYVRPDGQQIYGDGTPVMRDKDGQPRRRVSTIFGVDMAEGSVPSADEIRQKMQQAYG